MLKEVAVASLEELSRNWHGEYTRNENQQRSFANEIAVGHLKLLG
jgi:hypothetical protein